MSSHEGQCLCGNLVYSFEGEPINAVFCYCQDCQTTTGSDKWFGLWIPVDKFEFTKGEPAIYTRPGSSGQPVHYNFCPDCGTTICSEITAGKFYTVGASTLKDSSVFTPKMVIFTTSTPNWAVLSQDIPNYERFPESMGE